MTAVEALVEIIRVNIERGTPGFNGWFIWFYSYRPQVNTREKRNNSLSRLLSHDFSKSLLTGVRSEDITVDHLNRWINLLGGDRVLAIISEIKIARSFEEYYSSYFHHIPMMDFRCPKCTANLRRIEKFLKTIREDGGVILDSGRSYHYYGVTPLDEKDWLWFLGKCLLSELVDERYVGHRLIDRCGILRMSASSLRQEVPRVVAIL